MGPKDPLNFLLHTQNISPYTKAKLSFWHIPAQHLHPFFPGIEFLGSWGESAIHEAGKKWFPLRTLMCSQSQAKLLFFLYDFWPSEYIFCESPVHISCQSINEEHMKEWSHFRDNPSSSYKSAKLHHLVVHNSFSSQLLLEELSRLVAIYFKAGFYI